MLKEPDYTLFDDIKMLVHGALKLTHLEFNPQSDNYKEDDLNERAEREAALKIRLEHLKKNSKIKKGVKKSDLEATYRELFDIMDSNSD
jgi:predicted DNA binding CopG/RHH family protein